MALELSATITGLLGPLAAAVERMGVTLDLDVHRGCRQPLRPHRRRTRLQAPERRRPVDRHRAWSRAAATSPSTREGRVRRRARARLLRVPRAQGDRHHHDPDARRRRGLLAAHHHHRRVRRRHPARLRLHADRRRRPARPEPHDEPGAARRGRPHGRDRQRSCSRNDIIANAPKIISDLRTFFPPQQGTFLIGPMVKLGWGTPTLVGVSLGVIIEIPGNIAILGILRVAMPAEDAALIVLQVNFIGAIEFDKKRHLVLRLACSSRGCCSSRSTARWGCSSPAATTPTSCSASAGSTRVLPAAAAVPDARAGSASACSTRRSPRCASRATSRSPRTPSSSAPVPSCSSASMRSTSRATSPSTRCSSSRRSVFIIEISASLSVKVFGIGLFSVRRPRRRSRAPRRGTSRATGSISLLFLDIDVDFERTWGERRRHRCRRSRCCRSCATSSTKRENWTRRRPHRAPPLGRPARPSRRHRRWCCTRWASCTISQRALPLDLTARQGRQPAAERRRACHAAGRRPRAASGAPMPPSSSPPPSSRTSPTPPSCRAPAFEAQDAGLDSSASPVTTSPRLTRSSGSCATRRSSSTPTSSEHFAAVLQHRPALFTLFLARQRRRPLELSHGHGDQALRARSTSRSPSAPRRTPSPQQATTRRRRRRRRASPARQAPRTTSARRWPGPRLCRRPPRGPAPRDGGGMTDPIGTYSFLPWLRRGIANRIGAGRPRRGDRAPRSTSTVTIEGSRGATAGRRPRAPGSTSRCTGPATSSASTPRAISASSRATGSRTSSRTTSRRSSSTTRTCRGATRPRRPTDRRPPAPWLALVVLDRGASSRDGGVASDRPLPYIECSSTSLTSLPPAVRAVGLGPRPRQPDLCDRPRSCRPTPRGRSPPLSASARREPRPGLLPASSARGKLAPTRPTTRS